MVGKASAGEILGEIGVLCGQPHPFGVRTNEISQILRLNKRILLRILRSSPEDERVVMNNIFMKLKACRGLDIEGQQDPSLILKNWIGREAKQDSHYNIGTKDHDDKETVNSSTEDGPTALHIAVRHAHLEMARLLLERGANVNKPDERGWTPKELAEKHASRSMHDLILNYEDDKKSEGAIDYSANHCRGNPCASNSSSYTHPSGVEETQLKKKRVTIHRKSRKDECSTKQLPKLIILPDSLQELLKIAGQKFGDDSLKTVVNAENAEIDELDVVRDGDHLFMMSSQCRKAEADVN